jgi:hypothetical protein
MHLALSEEEFIEEAEARTRVPTFQHSELLPEHEILQNKIPAVTEEANQGSDPEKEQAEHGTELYQINDSKYCCRLLIMRSARVLARARVICLGGVGLLRGKRTFAATDCSRPFPAA